MVRCCGWPKSGTFLHNFKCCKSIELKTGDLITWFVTKFADVHLKLPSWLLFASDRFFTLEEAQAAGPFHFEHVFFANATFYCCFRAIRIACCSLFHNNWYFIFIHQAKHDRFVCVYVRVGQCIICALLCMIWEQMSSGIILGFYDDMHQLDNK